MKVSPIALVGALSLVALASNFISIEQNLSDWLTVWKSITRPIWDFLIGWFFTILGVPFPLLLKDYFTAGVVFASSAMRADVFFIISSGKTLNKWTERRDILMRWMWDFITWPIGILKLVLFGAITLIGLAIMKRFMRNSAEESERGSLDRATTELVSAATVIEGSMRVFLKSFLVTAHVPGILP